jgi:hypothetical protein
MRKTKTTTKGGKQLKKFEQFDPEAVQDEDIAIDVARLQKMLNMATPILTEIGNIIEQDADRTIGVEYRQKVDSAIAMIDDLKIMYT